MIGYHPIFKSFAPILSCSVTVAVCCDMMIGKNGFCRFDGPVQVGTQQPGSNSNNMSANGTPIIAINASLIPLLLSPILSFSAR